MIRWLLIIVIFAFSVQAIAKEPTYITLLDKVTDNFFSNLGKEKRLYLQGYGGSMMENVKKVGISFCCLQSVTIEEARQLYIELVESYVKLINENQKLRPYLNNYPINHHNLEFDISFIDAETRQWKKNTTCLVSYIEKKDILYYCAYDENNKLVDLYEEPYEEALRLVNQKKEL